MKKRLYTYKGIVKSTYDGDTTRLSISFGMDTWLKNQSFRLYGIDAPELRGETKKAGKASRDFLRQILFPGREIIIETIKDKKGKYGRYIAKIWFENTEEEWVCVNDLLVSEGHAIYRKY